MIALVMLAAIGAVTAHAGARAVARVRSERARRRAAALLPSAVADLSRSLRAGATLEVALREVAPSAAGVLGTELRGAVTLLDRGHSMARVLEVWGSASRVTGVDLVVAACRFSLGRSVALAAALDGVATALLDRVEVDDEVRALAAQARTSAVVLVALPPAGAALFCMIDPGFASVVLTTPAGRLCLVAGVTLDSAGAWASRALVRRAVDGRSGSRRRRTGPSGRGMPAWR